MNGALREDKGLTEAEVAMARKRYGANRVSAKKTRGFFARLLENFGDPMIKILLVALGVNSTFLFRSANWYETASIAGAVLAAVLISTLSEHGSETAFKRLQEEAARSRCRAFRQGGLVELPAEEVVVGDLVSLQAGDKAPADGVLVRGRLEVDQSALNGETKEAVKTACGVIAPGHAAASRFGGPPGKAGDLLDSRLVFSGTVVGAGEGVMRVTAVGDETFYGMLAGEVQEEKGKSPLKERLSGLARTISRLGYIGAALVAVAFLFNAVAMDNGLDPARIVQALRAPGFLFETLLHAATLAVTVIVMAVPEGLPMMITVVLSSNMGRMLKDNVLVRKLVGIETAGSLNILFADKTGTLTLGRPQVVGFIDGSGKVWPDGELPGMEPLWRELHRAVRFNCAASLSEGRAIGGNPTDRALLEYVSRRPLPHRLSKGRETPFDPGRKYMATEVSGEFSGTLIKGAAELLLPLCASFVAADGRVLPFTGARQVQKAMAAAQDDAARLIAVAVTERRGAGLPDGRALTLVGVLSVRDDVRPEAARGVRRIQEAGVQVVMMTGDAKLTAEAIARKTGLLQGPGDVALTSQELGGLTDAEVEKLLPRLRVVARALPHDKSRLVRVAQGMGLVAGMTGDGVNDAPALKRADIGFAMGSGTEVAKEAGDIVILDDNLLSIAKAVQYGRTVFKSLRKFIIFQLTLNFCAMGVSILAPLLGIDSPITVIQMLWINMVMDTLAGLAFAGEPALDEYMREPPKRRDEPILNGYMWREIALGSLYAVALCLWFLKSPLAQGIALDHGMTRYWTCFFALFMFTGIFNSFCTRTHRFNLADHLAGNKGFALILGTVSLIQIGLLYFGGSVFRTNGLSLRELGIVLGLSSTAVLAHLLRKLWYGIRKLPEGT